ncbi:MAG: YidH family protein [Steroidobacteraceae bacterium]
MSEANEPEQIVLMKRLVELSAGRSQMSAERTFMNAERTLAVWIRTALALMVFGIAIDRFGLLLRQMPLPQTHGHLSTNDLSSWGGEALIALGVLMAVSSCTRFFIFSIAYRRVHRLPAHHGPYLGPIFAALVALFGIALLVILRVFTA